MLFHIMNSVWNMSIFLVDEYYCIYLGSLYHLEILVLTTTIAANVCLIVSMQFEDPLELISIFDTASGF